MKRVTALLACLLLAACGQKGNLYLPDRNQSTAVPVASPAPAPANPADAGATEDEQRQRQQQQQQQPAAPGTTGN